MEQVLYCPSCGSRQNHQESIEDGTKVYCTRCGAHHNTAAGEIRVKIMLNLNDATHEKVNELLELAKLLGAGSKELLRNDSAGNVYMDLSGELITARKEVRAIMAPLTAPKPRAKS